MHNLFVENRHLFQLVLYQPNADREQQMHYQGYFPFLQTGLLPFLFQMYSMHLPGIGLNIFKNKVIILEY